MKTWYNYPKVKEDDPCRFCLHKGFFHMEVKYLWTARVQARWDKCIKPATNCPCPGFAPVDNLQYLEMMHEEKI